MDLGGSNDSVQVIAIDLNNTRAAGLEEPKPDQPRQGTPESVEMEFGSDPEEGTDRSNQMNAKSYRSEDSTRHG